MRTCALVQATSTPDPAPDIQEEEQATPRPPEAAVDVGGSGSMAKVANSEYVGNAFVMMGLPGGQKTVDCKPQRFQCDGEVSMEPTGVKRKLTAIIVAPGLLLAAYTQFLWSRDRGSFGSGGSGDAAAPAEGKKPPRIRAPRQIRRQRRRGSRPGRSSRHPF